MPRERERFEPESRRSKQRNVEEKVRSLVEAASVAMRQDAVVSSEAGAELGAVLDEVMAALRPIRSTSLQEQLLLYSKQWYGDLAFETATGGAVDRSQTMNCLRIILYAYSAHVSSDRQLYELVAGIYTDLADPNYINDTFKRLFDHIWLQGRKAPDMEYVVQLMLGGLSVVEVKDVEFDKTKLLDVAKAWQESEELREACRERRTSEG